MEYLAHMYEERIGFPIDDRLRAAVEKMKPPEPAAGSGETRSHGECMEILDSKIDREYAELKKKWAGLTFEEALECTHKFLVSFKAYDCLKNRREQFPVEKLDLLSQRKGNFLNSSTLWREWQVRADTPELAPLLESVCQEMEYTRPPDLKEETMLALRLVEGGEEMETRGITVKVPIGLHNAVRQKLEQTEMTMSEYITMVIEKDLYAKEDDSMEKQKTMAFQMPVEMFQRLKACLLRNGISQKKFVLDLIEKALEEDEAKYHIPNSPATVDSGTETSDGTGTSEASASEDVADEPNSGDGAGENEADDTPNPEDSTGEDAADGITNPDENEPPLSSAI